ncbi:MAG TPA: class II fructose-bisphosphate aldolase [Anaerolineales bacterium]
MGKSNLNDLTAILGNSLRIEDGTAVVTNPARLRANIHRLAEISALESGPRQGMARYLTRLAAQGMGILPSSINDLYRARGRGEIPPTFTVPAINLRALSFEAAIAVFRAAKALDAGAFIFEIARSEVGYTGQRPAEYATNVLAAAIVEDYRGPVFIQGDHFQVSAKRYGSQPEAELQAVRDLTQEAIDAGFFNIDIDTSTLVDISQAELSEQQALNTQLSAMFTALVRSIQPDGIVISVGGEIGEVGGHNSTEPELRAYMDGYQRELEKLSPGAAGLSKISIQTGTSHGGVVLPDGTIQEVAVDFDTLRRLSRIARHDYGMGGAVQHGASTLPESAFHKFVEAEANEVHLATNFMNMLFDRLPPELKADMYRYLDEKFASERKPGMTDEQFYYKTRKNAVGPFKAQTWNLPEEHKVAIRQTWQDQFAKLFRLLGLEGTQTYIEQAIRPAPVKPKLKFYVGEAAEGEQVSDLAD